MSWTMASRLMETAGDMADERIIPLSASVYKWSKWCETVRESRGVGEVLVRASDCECLRM